MERRGYLAFVWEEPWKETCISHCGTGIEEKYIVGSATLVLSSRSDLSGCPSLGLVIDLA